MEETTRNVLVSLFFLLGGIFTFAGGAFGWGWFLHSRRARPVVNILGPTGARTLYMVLGTVFFLLGALALIGLLVS